MNKHDNIRDIIHELADTLTHLGDDYTLTGVDCEPGDSAGRIIKRNSEKTMYIIALSDPDDTEMRLYDENGDMTAQYCFYNGAFDNLTPADIADDIKNLFREGNR